MLGIMASAMMVATRLEPAQPPVRTPKAKT